MKRTIVALAACVTALLSGCGADEPEQKTVSVTDLRSEEITRDDFGDEWPFTVDSGTLRCDGNGRAGAITFEADGKSYAVNGTAETRGSLDIGPIWADSPDVDGLKINMGPILDRGHILCQF